MDGGDPFVVDGWAWGVVHVGCNVVVISRAFREAESGWYLPLCLGDSGALVEGLFEGPMRARALCGHLKHSPRGCPALLLQSYLPEPRRTHRRHLFTTALTVQWVDCVMAAALPRTAVGVSEASQPRETALCTRPCEVVLPSSKIAQPNLGEGSIEFHSPTARASRVLRHGFTPSIHPSLLGPAPPHLYPSSHSLTFCLAVVHPTPYLACSSHQGCCR
ncbi:hypothetical protein BS50DRAFT_61504 [Corynespora cassiicola Philippines]|uniref:Uncharacterized protein n=1 Tax=Corynespora cassiicola Philippines TaxID=1448308 RepID=A0A2T2NJD6_CORCC|nr:hypothetical protein BS50DRAFT_61504 [Corynespora cassiicola Philippines]